MKKVDLAYIAGLFDGEGCITYTRKGKAGMGLLVTLGQTEEYLIRWLQIAYSGSVYIRKPPVLFPNAKMLYVWRLFGRQASNFLKDIVPYLKVKKPQAELALRFQGYLDSGHWGGKGHPLTEEQKAIRETYSIMISNLNKRGR